MKAPRILVILLSLALLAPAAAAAEQLDARTAPATEGPLTGGDASCRRQVETKDDRTVAVVRLCSRLYALAPASEADEANDYGVLWLQSNVDAAEGWCAVEVNTSAAIGEGGAVYDTAPGTRRRASKRKRIEVTLTVDAQGEATETATASQSLLMYPRQMKPIIEPTNQGTDFTLKWVGSVGRKLAFASGVELSWPAGIGSPAIEPTLTYRFEKKGEC
jgi:hypothetical protein